MITGSGWWNRKVLAACCEVQSFKTPSYICTLWEGHSITASIRAYICIMCQEEPFVPIPMLCYCVGEETGVSCKIYMQLPRTSHEAKVFKSYEAWYFSGDAKFEHFQLLELNTKSSGICIYTYDVLMHGAKFVHSWHKLYTVKGVTRYRVYTPHVLVLRCMPRYSAWGSNHRHCDLATKEGVVGYPIYLISLTIVTEFT